MIVSSALMIWKGLMVVTGSESPIVVVLSGSMEPAFQVKRKVPSEETHTGTVYVIALISLHR
jgi:signal peptidase I